MSLSVIIPVLNEARLLPSTLASVRAALGEVEIIVADGDSDDTSREIAMRYGARVLTCARGRARQMNAGARLATGDVFLFLHADTLLPSRAEQLVAAALARGCCWGRFDVRIAGRAFMLRVVAALMNVRSRVTGIATGDQAIFAARSAFEAVGGYPDQPLMEDIELCRRLRSLSPPACLAAHVTTSGRRWERNGVWRTIVLMWRLRWAYWRGVSAQQLANYYA
jgi:rSAM/selenodomain-associated transferase 2